MRLVVQFGVVSRDLIPVEYRRMVRSILRILTALAFVRQFRVPDPKYGNFMTVR